jgi:uncharacterized membrane protein
LNFAQVSAFVAKWIPSWLCYLLPLISIYYSTVGAGFMAVGGGFVWAAGAMVVIAILAPKQTRLRFHAVQMLLFCVIYFALMLLVVFVSISSLGESVRRAGPNAGVAGGMLAIYVLGIVAGGGSILFGIILIFLAGVTARGRDVRLPVVGLLAARITSFQR